MTWDGKERRKQVNGFKPSPDNAFEGYVYAKLEGIDEKFTNLSCNDMSKRIGKCEQKIANMAGKASAFGFIGGAIMVWIKAHFWK